MNKSYEEIAIEEVQKLSVMEIQIYFESFLDKKNLEFANWMYKKLGFDSFFHYFKLDFKNVLIATKNPTKVQNTLFYKSLLELRNEMKNPLKINKLFIFLKIWFQSKKLEKLTVQIFMHTFSNQDSKELAYEIKKSLEVNNEYHKSQSKDRNIDFVIESINEIVSTYESNALIKCDEKELVFNPVTSIQVVGYFYLKEDYSKIIELSIFLEKFDFIDQSQSFSSLFKTENVIKIKKVNWKKKLSSLCFLVHCLMILKIIPESSQWAKLTSLNFLSISLRKNNPTISPKSLTSIKGKHKLSTLSLNGLKTNRAFQEDSEMNSIRLKLLELFES